MDGDAWAVREFVKAGMELFVAVSFSKNFGLYSKYWLGPITDYSGTSLSGLSITRTQYNFEGTKFKLSPVVFSANHLLVLLACKD